MSESIKATRATVMIGEIAMEGFMLPDGSYQMSQTQTAETVGLGVQNVSDFLKSKALKSLSGEGYTPQTSEIESEADQQRGGSRIKAVPLTIVRKYWLWQAFRGNKKALALVDALMAETLERRFDDVFGVTQTEQQRNDRLSARVQQLESDLAKLGEEFEFENFQSIELNTYKEENNRLREALEEQGFDPNDL
jgi:hypothetical protein